MVDHDVFHFLHPKSAYLSKTSNWLETKLALIIIIDLIDFQLLGSKDLWRNGRTKYKKAFALMFSNRIIFLSSIYRATSESL